MKKVFFTLLLVSAALSLQMANAAIDELTEDSVALSVNISHSNQSDDSLFSEARAESDAREPKSFGILLIAGVFMLLSRKFSGMSV